MPYQKAAKIERLPLPSDSAYYIDWKYGLTYKDVKTIARMGTQKREEVPQTLPLGTQVPVGTTQAPPDNPTEVDSAAAMDAILCAHIVSWNLDDLEGNMLPITPESLDILTEEDVNFLAGLVNNQTKEQEGTRKNSGKPSTASSTAR